MLKIRAEQLEAFRPVLDAALAAKIATDLRERHPDLAVRLSSGTLNLIQLPDSTLHQLVRDGIARAREYGFSSEFALSAFATIRFTKAPNFDSDPLIQSVLRDESVTPDARLDLLSERISTQTWEMVEKEYDPGAWQIT